MGAAALAVMPPPAFFERGASLGDLMTDVELILSSLDALQLEAERFADLASQLDRLPEFSADRERLQRQIDDIAYSTDDALEQQQALENDLHVAIIGTKTKVDGCVAFFGQLNGDELMVDHEIARLTARKRRIERKRGRLENFIFQLLELRGEDKLAGFTSTLRVKQSTAGVLEVQDLDAVPLEWRHAPKPVMGAPDKNAIKKHIKVGHEVPGCRLTYPKKLAVE